MASWTPVGAFIFRQLCPSILRTVDAATSTTANARVASIITTKATVSIATATANEKWRPEVIPQDHKYTSGQRKGFLKFLGITNVHLDNTLLHERGIDPNSDRSGRRKEGRAGEPCFSSNVTKNAETALNMRPQFRIEFDKRMDRKDTVWE